MSFDVSNFDVADEDFFDNEEDFDAAANYRGENINEDTFDDYEDYEEWSDYLGDNLLDPNPKDWKDIPFNQIPDVTFDKARNDLWTHCKKEINYIQNKIVESESNYDIGVNTQMDKVADIIAGPDSELFHVYKKIVGNSTTYADFAEWIGAFYFSCQMNKNYGKLDKHNRIDNNGLAGIESYNTVWRKFEAHGKGSPYHQRSWSLLQESLNKTLKQNFLPTPKEVPLQICLDDDKGLFEYQALRNVPIDNESNLGRQHHVADNRKGFTAHMPHAWQQAVCQCRLNSSSPTMVYLKQLLS